VIGLFELISEFSRIISFSFRLFGNIFAGEVMLGIIAFLVPILVPFPFLVMEIFVGVLQAFVFAMLTAVFVNLAISHH
jgi:F-type H+-transporting ATPase subunit a